MADLEFEPRGGLHSNRVKPLLNDFPLKLGRITIARLSQAKGRKTLVLAGGEMMRAPMSYSGTSGVVRFDAHAGDILDRLMGEALEHHYGFVYGEHRPVLRALAGRLGLEIMELT